MSESQFPTDAEIAEALPSDPSPGGGNPSGVAPTSPPELPDEYKIGDQTYSREAVEDKMLRWERMEGAHTQRSQANAEERRALAEEREELARLRSELDSRSTSDYEDVDDVGAQILKRLEKIEQRDVQRERGQRAEEEWHNAIMQHSQRPLFNYAEMDEYMRRNNLGPEHAAVAYNARYDRRIGETVGEQNAAHRIEFPVMGSTPGGFSPGFTGHHEVPQPRGTERSVEDTSWEDLDRMAAEDESIS